MNAFVVLDAHLESDVDLAPRGPVDAARLGFFKVQPDHPASRQDQIDLQKDVADDPRHRLRCGKGGRFAHHGDRDLMQRPVTGFVRGITHGLRTQRDVKRGQSACRDGVVNGRADQGGQIPIG